MVSLEEFIITQTNFTRGELQQATFAYPSFGTIEAVRRKMGEQASQELLELLSQYLKLKLLDPSILLIDKQLIQDGGEELQRLIYCFKAIPLFLIGKDEAVGVRLAMCNPFDEEAKRAFAAFYSTEIVVQLAHESELFAAFDEVVTKLDSASDFREKYKNSAKEKAEPLVAEDIQAQIEKVIVQAIGFSSNEIEFEFRDSSTRAIIALSLDRARPVDLPVSSEPFVGGIVEHSAISGTKDSRFDGRAELQVRGVDISAQVTFQDYYRNRNGGEGKALILSDIRVKPKHVAAIWQARPEQATTHLKKSLETRFGLFIAGAKDLKVSSYLASTLQRRYPSLHVVHGLDAMAKQPLLAKQIRHCPVLVLEPCHSLPELIDKLNRFPRNSRSLIRSVFSFSRLPRNCYFCQEDTNPTPATLQLFPEAIRESIKTLKYPRSCGVCGNTGYCGAVDLLAVLPMESKAGQAFQQGATSADIKKMLRASGVQTALETGLQAVLDGQSTIEMLYQTLLGKSDFSKQQLLTVGREILQDGKVIASGTEKYTSPLGSPKKKNSGSMKDYHSVVLQLGDDVMAMRDAIIAKNKAEKEDEEEGE